MGNSSSSNNNDKEIETYFERKKFLPCFLNVDAKGGFKSYNNGFKEVKTKKINFNKKEIFELEIIDSDVIAQESVEVNHDAFLNIAYIHSDTIFKREAKNLDNYRKKSKLLVGKFVLYEINIDPGDVKFSKHIVDEMKGIAKSKQKNSEKAKTLDRIIKSYGFFIPLSVSIGGLFVSKEEDIHSLEKKSSNTHFSEKVDTIIKSDYKYNNLSSSDIDALFKSTKINIKGGDIHKQHNDFESWKKSINISNCEIIGYSFFKNFEDCLESNIKIALEAPFRLMENKYELRKKYCETISQIKNSNYNFKSKGNHNISVGICEEKEFPKIYAIHYTQEGDGGNPLGIKKTLSDSYEDIIVGYRIEECWKDGTNGTWIIESNPLLKKSANFDFKSKFFRGEKFKISIYVMKFPE